MIDLSIEMLGPFAEHSVTVVKKIYGFDLDFSASSLDLLDGVIESLRQDKHTYEEVGLSLYGYGCYLGEVIVRKGIARWIERDTLPQNIQSDFANSLLLQVDKLGLILDPIGKTLKRFMHGEDDSVPAFYYFVIGLIEQSEKGIKHPRRWQVEREKPKEAP